MKTIGKRTEKIRFLPVGKILPNPVGCTRKMRDGDLDRLADSIKHYGILQPLLVSRCAFGFQLLCGSRRLQAARLAGLDRVPCREVQFSPKEAGELFLAENLNRRGLTPLEEALSADRLTREFPYRQGELAERVGETPSELSAKLRILRFTSQERQLLIKYGFSLAYAEVFLHVRDPALRLFAIGKAGEEGLSLQEASDYCLSLALHPEEFVPPLHPKPAQTAKVRRFVVKDVGFFINSVDRAIGSIRQAGFAVEAEKVEGGEYVSYSIRIPKYKFD